MTTDATANSLIILKKKLDESQAAYDELTFRCTQENQILLRLITHLSQICRGHNRELDNRLAGLRAQLKGNGRISEYQDELVLLEKILWEHSHKFDASLRGLTDSFTSAGQKLLRTPSLPTVIKGELRTLLGEEPPYGLSEHIGRLAKLMTLHTQALYALHLQTRQGKPSPEVPPGQHKRRDLHNQITDELQRLIPELGFTGEFGEQLAKIRVRLLVGVEPSELPPLCIELIRLVTEGARAERRASQAFLAALNESLSEFQRCYGITLGEQAELLDNQQRNTTDLRQHLQHLDNSLTERADWNSLKSVVRHHLDQVSQLLLRKEELEATERSLLERLASYEANLREMERENEEYQRRLNLQQRQLHLDSLTQVGNRGALDERLELEFRRWLRYRHDCAIAVIDIDHFKLINDRFGHMAGDKALKVVARALQKAIRQTDFVARFGGEEFVILLPQTNLEALNRPLEKIRRTIKSIPFSFKDERVSITVSIGASLFRHGDEIMSAFERADQALYDAKRQGRDRLIVKL